MRVRLGGRLARFQVILEVFGRPHRPALVGLAPACVAVLVVVAAACGLSSQEPAPLQLDPADNSRLTRLSTPSALPPGFVRTPTSTPMPPAPTPTTRPPSTFTPVPAVPMRITAALEPPTPRAETDFVLRLTVANDGDRPARGAYVATSGPWDRWTVLQVLPPGMFGRDAAGWHIVSPIEIPPGESRILEVRIRANEASEEQLSFAVREAQAGELHE